MYGTLVAPSRINCIIISVIFLLSDSGTFYDDCSLLGREGAHLPRTGKGTRGSRVATSERWALNRRIRGVGFRVVKSHFCISSTAHLAVSFPEAVKNARALPFPAGKSSLGIVFLLQSRPDLTKCLSPPCWQEHLAMPVSYQMGMAEFLLYLYLYAQYMKRRS